MIIWDTNTHPWPIPRKTPLINTLSLKQNCYHFPYDIFKYIFLTNNVWISIKFSLTFVLKGPINNIPALIQMMAWRRSGDKQLSEPIKGSLLTPICVTRTQRVKWASGSSNYVSLTSLQIQLSTERSICFHNDWSLLLSNIQMGSMQINPLVN